MLLTFTSAYQPATDLGSLLHKNPTCAVVRSCLWSGTCPLSRSYPGALYAEHTKFWMSRTSHC